MTMPLNLICTLKCSFVDYGYVSLTMKFFSTKELAVLSQ